MGGLRSLNEFYLSKKIELIDTIKVTFIQLELYWTEMAVYLPVLSDIAIPR